MRQPAPAGGGPLSHSRYPLGTVRQRRSAPKTALPGNVAEAFSVRAQTSLTLVAADQ
jgi:hypothetical protein